MQNDFSFYFLLEFFEHDFLKKISLKMLKIKNKQASEPRMSTKQAKQFKKAKQI